MVCLLGTVSFVSVSPSQNAPLLEQRKQVELVLLIVRRSKIDEAHLNTIHLRSLQCEYRINPASETRTHHHQVLVF